MQGWKEAAACSIWETQGSGGAEPCDGEGRHLDSWRWKPGVTRFTKNCLKLLLRLAEAHRSESFLLR